MIEVLVWVGVIVGLGGLAILALTLIPLRPGGNPDSKLKAKLEQLQAQLETKEAEIVRLQRELNTLSRDIKRLQALNAAIRSGAVSLKCPNHPDAAVRFLADGTIVCEEGHRLWPK